MEQCHTIIEITPNNFKSLTGYEKDGAFYVVKTLSSPNFTLNDGSIGYEDAKRSLTWIIEETKKALRTEVIDKCVFLYVPDDFATEEGDGDSATKDRNNVLSIDDYTNCAIRATKVKIKPGNKFLHCVPYLFKIDNDVTTEHFPIGEKTSFLDIKADIHTINGKTVDFWWKLFTDLQLADNCISLVSSYCGITLLNKFSNTSDYVAMEYEDDYCYLSFVKADRLKESTVYPFGLNMVCTDVAKSLSISQERAKYLLRIFSFSNDASFPFITEENLTLPMISQAFITAFSRQAREIYQAFSPLGEKALPFIIYGKGAKVDNIDSLFSKLFNLQTSLFSLTTFGVRNGEYDNCLGALIVANYSYLAQDSSPRAEIYNTLKF